MEADRDMSAELSGNDLQNLQDILQNQRGWLATSHTLSQLEHLLTKQCLSRLLQRKLSKQLFVGAYAVRRATDNQAENL